MIIGGVKRPAVVRARRKQTPVSSFVPSRPEVSVGRPRHVAPHPVARAKVISRPPPGPHMQPTGRTRGGGRSYASPDAARDTVKALRTLRVINPKTGRIRVKQKVQRFASVEDWQFKSARAAQVRATTDAIIHIRQAQGRSAIQIADELIASKPRIRNDFQITANRFKRQATFHSKYGYGPDARHDQRVDLGLEEAHGNALTKTLRSARDMALGLPASVVEMARAVPEVGQLTANLEAKLGLPGAGRPRRVKTPHTDAIVKGYKQGSVVYPIVRGAVRAVSHGDAGELGRGLETAHAHGARDPLAYTEFFPGLGAAGKALNVAKHGSEAAATARAASYAGRAGGASVKAARAANSSARLAVQSQRELSRLTKLRREGKATDAQVEAAARKAEQHGKAALPPKSATAVKARRYSRSPYVRVVQKAGEAVQHRRGKDSRYKRGRAGKRIVRRSSEGARRRAQSGGLGVETDVAQAIGKQKLVNRGIVFSNHAAQRLHNAAVRFSHTGEVMPGRELHDLREIRDTIDAHIKEASKELKGPEVLRKLRANRAIVEKLASDFARRGAESHIAKGRRITDGAKGSKALADALDRDLVELGYVTAAQAQFRRKAVRQFSHGNAAMGKRPDQREGVDLSSLSSEDLRRAADDPDRSAAFQARARAALDARTGLSREKVRAGKRELRATRLERERGKAATAAPARRSEPARPVEVPAARVAESRAQEAAPEPRPEPRRHGGERGEPKPVKAIARPKPKAEVVKAIAAAPEKEFERATREATRRAAKHVRKPVHESVHARPGKASGGGELPAARHKRNLSADEMALRHQFASTRKGAQRGKPDYNWPTAKLEKHARQLQKSGKHPERLNAALLELEERRTYGGAAKRPGEIPKLLAELERKHKQPELGRAEAIQKLRDEHRLPDEGSASAETEPLHAMFDRWASKLNGTERSLRREGQHVGDTGLHHQERATAAIARVIHALNDGNQREASVAARDAIEEISANADVERLRQLERSQPDAADNPWVGEPGSRMPNARAVGKNFELLDEIRGRSVSGRYTSGAHVSSKEGGARGERQAGKLFAGPKGKGTSDELATTMPMTARHPDAGQAPLNLEHPREQSQGAWPSRAELPKSRELEASDRAELSSGELDMAAPKTEAHSGWEEYNRGRIKAAEAKLGRLEAASTGAADDVADIELARAALAAARAEELPAPVAEEIANAIADRAAHEAGGRPPKEQLKLGAPAPTRKVEASAKTKRMEESGDFAEVRAKRQTGVAGRVEAARRDFRKARSSKGLAEAIFKHRNVLRLRYTDAQLRAIAKRVGRELSKEDGWFNPLARNRLTRPDELRRAIESVLGPPRSAADHADLYAHLADLTEKALDDQASVALEDFRSPYFRRDAGDTIKRGMRLTSKSPVHEGSTFHFTPRSDRPGLAREKSSGQGFTGRSAIYEDMGAADISSSLLHQARARGQAMLSKAMLSFSYHGKAVPAHSVDLAALERETGFKWSLVKAKRRDQPGTLTPRLDGNAEHSSLFAKPARDDMVYAIPTATRDVWAGAVRRPGSLVQSGQWLTQRFVRGVLPFAASWHAGNYADQQMRLMAMGPGAMADGSPMAQALKERLAEGDLPPGLQHDILGFALGHFGTWSSIPKLRLADILEGKPLLGSVGHAMTRTVARKGHDGWEPKFFAKALAKPQDLMLHLGGKWEQGPIMRQVGAHATAQYRRMHGEVADFQTMARVLVDNWQQHPYLIDEFQNEVLQTVGDWAKSGRLDEALAAGPFPFVKWMENALKWTLWTIPTRHPNALTAAWLMSSLTREQRAKMGLEYWHTPQELYRQGLPKPQLPGNVVIGGKSVYLGSLFSATEAGQFLEDPAKWGVSKLLPMFQGPAAAAMTGNSYFEGSDVANPQRDIWSAKQARADVELVQRTLQAHGGGPVWILKGSTPFKYRILRYENGAPVIYEIHGRRKKWDKQPYNKGILGHDYVRGALQAGLQFLPGQKELTSHNIFPGTYGHWRITGRHLGSTLVNPAPVSMNRAALKGEGNRLGKGWSKAEDIRYSTPDSPFRVGSLEDYRKRQATVKAAKRLAREGHGRYVKNVAKLRETRRVYAVKAKKVQADFGPQGLLGRFHFRPEGTSERGPTLRQINKPVPVKVVPRSKWKVKQSKRRRAEHVAHSHGRLTASERDVVKYFDKQVSYRSQKIAQAEDFAGRIPGWWLAEKHFRPDGTKLYDPPLEAQRKRVEDYKRRRAKVVAKAHPRKRALVVSKVGR